MPRRVGRTARERWKWALLIASYPPSLEAGQRANVQVHERAQGHLSSLLVPSLFPSRALTFALNLSTREISLSPCIIPGSRRPKDAQREASFALSPRTWSPPIPRARAALCTISPLAARGYPYSALPILSLPIEPRHPHVSATLTYRNPTCHLPLCLSPTQSPLPG